MTLHYLRIDLPSERFGAQNVSVSLPNAQVDGHTDLNEYTELFAKLCFESFNSNEAQDGSDCRADCTRLGSCYGDSPLNSTHLLNWELKQCFDRIQRGNAGGLDISTA